jgi:hypothetical protein
MPFHRSGRVRARESAARRDMTNQVNATDNELSSFVEVQSGDDGQPHSVRAHSVSATPILRNRTNRRSRGRASRRSRGRTNRRSRGRASRRSRGRGQR